MKNITKKMRVFGELIVEQRRRATQLPVLEMTIGMCCRMRKATSVPVPAVLGVENVKTKRDFPSSNFIFTNPKCGKTKVKPKFTEPNPNSEGKCILSNNARYRVARFVFNTSSPHN
jgi:hypothetical protein